jgi:tetratricopeptide (TPR) repeat protein
MSPGFPLPSFFDVQRKFPEQRFTFKSVRLTIRIALRRRFELTPMRTRLLALLLGTCAIVAQETSPDGTAEIAPEDRAIFAKAFALEDAREWSKARAIYEEILLRQPDHAQAREGKTRATKVIAAEFQLEKCIAEAERQTAAGNFQAAIRAFNQAMTVKPDYVSKDRFQALRATLMEQNTPVEVTLKSDGST